MPAELAVEEIAALRQHAVERPAIDRTGKQHTTVPVERFSEFGINHAGNLRDAPNASKFPRVV